MLRAGVAIMMLAVCLQAPAANQGVIATLAPEKTALGKHENVIVRVTITNTTAMPQYVLKWQTPFGGIEESLFEVTRDGVRVSYLGAHYKRPAPTPADYYLLKPGDSHTARVELSEHYDMSITGDYAIRYNASAMNLFSNNPVARSLSRADFTLGEIVSPPVSVWIDGRQPRGSLSQEMLDLARMRQQPPGAPGLSFSKCSASQQSTVTTATAAAATMSHGSDAYLANGTPGERYNKWFGVNDTARIGKVTANFAAIKEAFASKPITVDCSCRKNYYAYVYANKPYVIYVCKAFWSAPMTGTDSKAGTLVHEMSHFTIVGGTEDWVYGQTGASSLAISDPAKAVDNADSHEYFSENTPPL